VRGDRIGARAELAVRHPEHRQYPQFLFRVAHFAVDALRFEERAHHAGVLGKLALRARPGAQRRNAQRGITVTLADFERALGETLRDVRATDSREPRGQRHELFGVGKRGRAREAGFEFGVRGERREGRSGSHG